jgi:hypothetical protein
MELKRFRILILVFLVSPAVVYSQQLSNQVLVPLAGVATGTNINYTQTVGETAVEIVGCSEYVFTQGFQQPNFRIYSEEQPPGTGVKVYPNPVTDYIMIELFGDLPRTYKIEIINIAGTVVMSDRKVFSGTYWYKEPRNIEDLISGIYFIRVMSEDRIINRIFKIEKL